MNPDKVVLILLQKISLRRSILAADDVRMEEVPQLGKSQDSPAKEVPRQPAKTWGDFLNYLKVSSPATASNLEHGNLIEEIDPQIMPLVIKVAFPEDAAVFKEFLEDKEIYARLKNYLADFFEIDIDKVQFKTQLITSEEKRDKNFKTKVEINDEVKKNREEERKMRILNDPFVKEAEKIFNAKIDKIILKDEEKK
jgi:DNA polymerase-3 subunit gamma/tau